MTTPSAPSPLHGWEALVAELPEGWRQAAAKHKILTIRRPPNGAKLTDVEQVLRLVLSYAGLGTSLLTTTANGATGGLVPALSSVSLHQWVRKSGPWLGDILAQLSQSDLLFAPGSWHGLQVVVADATVVTRPGSKGTDARVHYAVRLSDFAYLHCEVTDASGGEKLSRYPLGEGQLWLVDRGYCNPPAFQHAKENKAFLLARYNYGTLPLFNDKGESFDVVNALTALREAGETGQFEVWVRPKHAPAIRARLLAYKLTHVQTVAALERLRKEHGSTIPPMSRALAGHVLLLTDVPETLLDRDLLLRLYRLRWQVERIIMQDKSLEGMGKLPNFLPATIQCWLNAKMLLAALSRRLAMRATELAFPP